MLCFMKLALIKGVNLSQGAWSFKGILDLTWAIVLPFPHASSQDMETKLEHLRLSSLVPRPCKGHMSLHGKV